MLHSVFAAAEFLEELASDLEHGRAGDKTRLDSLAEKLEHWKDELQERLG